MYYLGNDPFLQAYHRDMFCLLLFYIVYKWLHRNWKHYLYAILWRHSDCRFVKLHPTLYGWSLWSLLSLFTTWCKDNFLDLNVAKTKELLIDFRKRPPAVPPYWPQHQPPFTGLNAIRNIVHITVYLAWSRKEEAISSSPSLIVFLGTKMYVVLTSPAVLTLHSCAGQHTVITASALLPCLSMVGQ